MAAVIAFDLAYRKTGWAVVDYDGTCWHVLSHGLIRGKPYSASPVTEHVRVQWAGSCLRSMIDVMAWSGSGIKAIVYESPATWLLAKARAQKYHRMRSKTSSEAILGFGAARERLYQAASAVYGDTIGEVMIVSVDPRRWQHVLDMAVLGDVHRLERKELDRKAVEVLTGLDLAAVSEDEVDAIGVGLWASRALTTGELVDA
jgi:hypothetical protein